MRHVERLVQGEAIVYVAGRLFDIDEKLKSEALEGAILEGVNDAASSLGLSVERRVTYVPFRDAGQEELVLEDKTRRLFEMDLIRLRRTALFVSYIDGLAKDEGVCFETGYAYAAGAAIVLVSTDFFDIELPNGQELPLDPLLFISATRLVRRPALVETNGTFGDQLMASRAGVLAEVRASVSNLLLEIDDRPRRFSSVSGEPTEVLLDFGGSVYEWQGLLQDELERLVLPHARLKLVRTQRYEAASPAAGSKTGVAHDLAALARAALLVTCTDADEAPSGTAFLQGAMCALGRPVWMYNSKRTAIRAAGGYRSSRNLMLDYSATRVFRTLRDLAGALSAFGDFA